MSEPMQAQPTTTNETVTPTFNSHSREIDVRAPQKDTELQIRVADWTRVYFMAKKRPKRSLFTVGWGFLFLGGAISCLIVILADPKPKERCMSIVGTLFAVTFVIGLFGLKRASEREEAIDFHGEAICEEMTKINRTVDDGKTVEETDAECHRKGKTSGKA